MSMPPTPTSRDPNPYDAPLGALKARVHRHLKDKHLDEKILELVRLSCDEALSSALREENIIISRAERTRFIQLISREVLLQLLAKQ